MYVLQNLTIKITKKKTANKPKKWDKYNHKKILNPKVRRKKKNGKKRRDETNRRQITRC